MNDLVSIVLLQPHTHSGTAHPAGATLAVSNYTATWLCERGVARVDVPRFRSTLKPRRGESTEPTKTEDDAHVD